MLIHLFQGIKTTSKIKFKVLKNDALKCKHIGGCAHPIICITDSFTVSEQLINVLLNQ